MKKSIEIVPNIENLFGTRDENLQILEGGLRVHIGLKSNSVEIDGAARDVVRAEQIFTDFDHLNRSGFEFKNGDLGSMLRVVAEDPSTTLRGLARSEERRVGKECRSRWS